MMGKPLIVVSYIALSAAARFPAPMYRAPVLAHLRMSAADKAVAPPDDDKEDRIGAGGRGGHAVGEQPEVSGEERELQMRVMKHQQSAARLSMAEDARSLVEYSTGYAVISTLSSAVRSPATRATRHQSRITCHGSHGTHHMARTICPWSATRHPGHASLIARPCARL